MSQHHTETLRFERQQSREMREAEWIDRLPPIRSILWDVLAAIGLTLGLAMAWWIIGVIS